MEEPSKIFNKFLYLKNAIDILILFQLKFTLCYYAQQMPKKQIPIKLTENKS